MKSVNSPQRTNARRGRRPKDARTTLRSLQALTHEMVEYDGACGIHASREKRGEGMRKDVKEVVVEGLSRIGTTDRERGVPNRSMALTNARDPRRQIARKSPKKGRLHATPGHETLQRAVVEAEPAAKYPPKIK
ncbi:hypothetical protein B0H16DRAFT_1479667 [Mycena metata]|uniref:Uncharacterized protein n=1 Tax=Mycena metata TaxID=1033252 RepID=A0AAD7H575_9AGAR|nr:hypothetical protein B0H16DRAFT_1479667 [Mycena metata]